MKRKLFVLSVAASLLLNAAGAAAQQRTRVEVAPPADVDVEVFVAQGPGEPAPPVPPQVEVRGDNLVFMATEMSFSGKLVKGAPYSAQAVTESVQTLSDGNRIVHKSTAQVYRDSEGRTRREQTLNTRIGPYTPQGGERQVVFINDPVGAVNYILEPESKTARKLPRMEFRIMSGAPEAAKIEGAKIRQGAVEKVEIERSFNILVPGPDTPPAPPVTQVAPPAPPAGDAPRVEFFSSHTRPDSKTEKLEARSFDGVTAEGTRTTTTIPAGEIGNELPIQIIDERWYSPELQLVVMTRHSDPRGGETTYRLTNISRAEPAAALFQLPSDYTVKEAAAPGTGARRTFRRTTPPPPEQQ